MKPHEAVGWQGRPASGRRGSFLLAIVGVLIVILLLTVNYMRYMMMQSKLSHRQGSQRMMAKVAHALATLATHKLAYGPLYGNDAPVPDATTDLGRLVKHLQQPLAAMPTSDVGELSLQDPANFDLTALVTPLCDLGQFFDFNVSWRVRRADFQPCGPSAGGFHREKRGTVHLTVTVKFGKAADGSDAITEEFHYLVRTKVTAALLPVLSKFTLYVEDAQKGLSGSFPDAFDYNAVRNDRLGNLMNPTPAKPLLLNNDGKADPPLPIERTFDGLVAGPRGLIYLGGPRNLVLNTARGVDTKTPGPQGNFGESFQLYMDAAGSGFVAERPEAPPHMYEPGGRGLVVSACEQGISDDPHTNNQQWYVPIARWPGVAAARPSSIFRLYGNEHCHSPTVVFGNVKSGVLLIRMFMSNPTRAPAPIAARPVLYWESPVSFPPSCLDPARYRPLVETVPELQGATAYQAYLEKFSSGLGLRWYNKALGYCIDQRKPDANMHFSPGDNITKLMNNDDVAAAATIRHAIPGPLMPLAPPGITDLKKIDPFIRTLDPGAGGPNGDRITWEIPAGETDIEQALRRRGLMQGDKLALNGWVRLAGERHWVISQPITYLCNGGIVLEKGDISIRAAIKPYNVPTRQPCVLQLVVREGDIIVDVPDGATEVRAALTANRRVRLAPGGSAASRPGPTINGAIAMGRLIDGPSDIVGFIGGELTYRPELAAMPGDDAEGRGETKALTCAFEPEPLVVE